MTFTTEPTTRDLEEISVWLKWEEITLRSGFYCNWDTIKKSFEQRRLFTLSLDGKIIGFICWSTYSYPYIEVDVMEIHPSFRGKGYGELLYNLSEDHFKRANFFTVKLFCEPEESAVFWKKMNFLQFPHRGYSESALTFYKPLIDVNHPSTVPTENKLELWNVESYQAKAHQPKWTWNIAAKTAPIIQPVNGDWNLRLTKSGTIVQEDKVKYFDSKNEILLGPFLYIDTSPYFD